MNESLVEKLKKNYYLTKHRGLKVVAAPIARDACSFYRVRQLVEHLGGLEGVEAVIMGAGISDEVSDMMLRTADIILLRPSHLPLLKYLKEHKTTYKAKIVFDHDDNTNLISPYSEHYKDYGTEEVEGLWKDGENGFDIARNKELVQDITDCIKEADLFTATTDVMLSAYESKNKAVIPNAIDFDVYPDVTRNKSKDEIRIGWQGGPSHYEDLYEVSDQIVRIMKKYPNVKLVIEGHYFKGLFKDIPKERIENYGWIESGGFSWRAKCLGIDIAMAPTADLPFNQYKSAIKFYHAGACKSAFIATNTEPHSSEVVSGYNGMLYDTPEEFFDKMSILIEDPIQRVAMANNAYNWVYANRNIDDIAKKAKDIYMKLVEGGC